MGIEGLYIYKSLVGELEGKRGIERLWVSFRG
jgi:hypothetical protein